MGISRVYVFDSWSHPSILLTRVPIKVNILVDQAGHARLADFGLLTIISDPKNLLSSSTNTQGGTARWMSPELIDPQKFGFRNSRPTKFSDCYALGMVIYETISGHLPFHEHTDLTVFVNVLKGERPHRGVGFTDTLWEMLKLCWMPQPKARPSIWDVLRCLEGVSQPREPLPPEINGEVDKCSDRVSSNDSSGTLPQCIPFAYAIFIPTHHQCMTNSCVPPVG